MFGGPVKEIVLSLGPTIRSPKEVFVLRFPLGFHDSEAKITSKQCSVLLFKQLVTSDFLGGDSPAPKAGSKLHLLVLAPRHCRTSLENLVPQSSYSWQRYRSFVIELTCTLPQADAELSRLEGWNGDMSGFEQIAVTPGRPSTKSFTSPVSEFNIDTASPCGQQNDIEQDDYVWYKLPEPICGYKHKP